MSDKKKHLGNLLKGAGFGFVNLGIGISLGLVLTPYIANTLGDRYYGIFSTAASFVGAFALLDIGIDAAVTRYFTLHYAKGEKEECIALSNTAFFLFLALGFIGFEYICLLGWGAYVFNPFMPDRGLFLAIILINAVTFGLSFPLKAFVGIINGTMRQELSGSRDVFFRIVGALSTFLIVYAGGRLIAISVANLLIALLNIVILFRLVRIAFPEFQIRFSRFRKDLLPKLFSYGSFTFLNFLGVRLKDEGGFLVIAGMISFEATASFKLVTLGLTGYFFQLTEAVCGTWLASWFTFLHADEDHALLEKTLRLAYKFCTYFATFIAFGLIFWSPDFIVCWAGERHMIAYASLVLITLGIWNVQSQAPNIKYLFAIAKHHFVGYASLVWAGLSIGLSILLIYCGWGIDGAAISSLISAVLVRGISIPYVVCRLRKESYWKYHLKMFSYMGIGIVGCIIPACIGHFLLGPNYPRLFMVGALSVLTYAPVVYWLGFSREERGEVQQLLLKKLWRKA